MERRNFLKSTSWFILSLGGAKLLASCSPSSTTSETPANSGIAEAEAVADTNAQTQSFSDLKELNFGIISTESQANQKPIWEPFIQAMSDELGMPINAFYATSYNGVIEAMRFGQVHLAWLGGKSYIEAAKIANAEAFAQTVGLDGSKGYYAYLITNKDNPIVSQIVNEDGDQYVIKNASDLTFAFNDPNSTSGFLVPSYYVFAKNNVNPKKVFKKLIFSGNHEATALAIANNQVDVATNNSESLSRLEKTNPAAREKIQVIWTSPEIPSDPIAYRRDLPEELKTKIKDFFYNYNDETVLGPLEWSGFIVADDKNWNAIRELEIGKQILEIQENENMDTADKEKKLNELNEQLKAVQG
ncbi:phosphonate ABC transporter substrate-binding protein [Lyngbya sp. PCC 8106]|uniref:phosphonate ABC transporter substrate-binding protein n=1 Tax=Lyngbya sp. (strain PCC 8106) TaxID=313612 RepID=UPI0000EACB42|nr:phosphonate ABC transporter substrate-binding protein [Lyngbya sp. PCC 8106]EAW34174.1 ABC tranporter, phosphate-binding protein [Lyngbya sp. PCC 8106]